MPIILRICRLSIDHEKLQLQIFHGKPVKILLLVKSEKENAKLTRIIDDKFFSQKLPIKTIGIEKNKDKNKGIKNKLNGIKILNVGSKVNEFAIQKIPQKKKPKPKDDPRINKFLKKGFFL